LLRTLLPKKRFLVRGHFLRHIISKILGCLAKAKLTSGLNTFLCEVRGIKRFLDTSGYILS